MFRVDLPTKKNFQWQHAFNVKRREDPALECKDWYCLTLACSCLHQMQSKFALSSTCQARATTINGTICCSGTRVPVGPGSGTLKSRVTWWRVRARPPESGAYRSWRVPGGWHPYSLTSALNCPQDFVFPDRSLNCCVFSSCSVCFPFFWLLYMHFLRTPRSEGGCQAPINTVSTYCNHSRTARTRPCKEHQTTYSSSFVPTRQKIATTRAGR